MIEHQGEKNRDYNSGIFGYGQTVDWIATVSWKAALTMTPIRKVLISAV